MRYHEGYLEVFHRSNSSMCQWCCNAKYHSSRQLGKQSKVSTSAVPRLSGRRDCCSCTQKTVTVHSLDSQRNLGLAGNLGNFLARRARVWDDSGRSPQIELEPERSFWMVPLSGQSVYEQTSGVLRHTESVRGVKIQEQDWVSDIQVLTLRTLADARSNDPARTQASVSSRAHRKLPALSPTQRHHCWMVPADRNDCHRPVQHRSRQLKQPRAQFRLSVAQRFRLLLAWSGWKA